ncbi:MAG: DUF4941 domain-containing protein [Thermosipho sp. (in: Bacteria)]|nr:DUF4941 domain-containing protein [Thermosipho sp. (in: thermotogales)]
MIIKKFLLFILLIPFSSFSFNIIIDDITINSSEVNFSTVEKILDTYSSYLNDDEKITIGSIGSFDYIEWHNKLIAFSNEIVVLNNDAKKNISIEDVLDFFDIKYFKDEMENYFLATMIINDLQDFGTYFQIDYLGKNSIFTLIENGNFYLISSKYVYFDKLYSPNEIILSKKISNTNDIVVNELHKKIIIQLIQTYKITNIKFFSFEEKVSEYDSNTFIVVFKNSNSNLIFIRNYSPDFNGNDWQRFSISNDIAKKISSTYNFKIYYIPFIQLPLDAPGIVIFTSFENWEKIKNFLEGEIK